jgi:hypothetical protein
VPKDTPSQSAACEDLIMLIPTRQAQFTTNCNNVVKIKTVNCPKNSSSECPQIPRMWHRKERPCCAPVIIQPSWSYAHICKRGMNCQGLVLRAWLYAYQYHRQRDAAQTVLRLRLSKTSPTKKKKKKKKEREKERKLDRSRSPSI